MLNIYRCLTYTIEKIIGQLTDIFSGLLTLATVICVDKYGIGHRGRTPVEALNEQSLKNSMDHMVHNEQNVLVNLSILGSHWG